MQLNWYFINSSTTDFVYKSEWGCDHELAYKYYIESLNYEVNDTYYYARPCNDWKQYTENNCTCGYRAQYMGYHVNQR